MIKYRSMRQISLTVCLAAIFIAQAATAATWVKQPVSVYYENAQIVARVLVKRAEAVEVRHEGELVWCTTNVVADVVELLKGEAETVEFQIEGMVLNLREEYLVFLEPKAEPDNTPIASSKSVSQSPQAVQRRACVKTSEGLQANWLSTSRFVVRWSPDAGEFEPWVMPAYNILIPKDAGLDFMQVELRSLVVDGEEVVREVWSVSDEFPMPHEFWMYQGAFSWKTYRRHILNSKPQSHE